MNEMNEIVTVTNQSVQAVAPTINRFSDEGFNLVADMTTAQLSYCSIKAETDTDKAKLYNAMNNPDGRLADCINMTIAIKDLYIEVVNCTNEETGEVTACPRIVIIDDKGKSYQCVSIGIYSSLKKIIQIFGEPTAWTKPVKVMVKQITKGKKQMLTLNVETV